MKLRDLTSGLFDYAGMFPPAALSFEDALRESAGFPSRLRRPDLVANDMVLTPATLGDLTPDALDAAGFERRCRVCLVGVPLDESEAQAQAAAILNGSQDRIRITTVEVHADALDGAPDALRAARKAGIPLFFEPKWDAATTLAGIDEAAGMLHGLRSDGARIGLKFRCAGPTALDPAALASTLQAITRHDLPSKATQGLHHPLAGDERYGNEHGFLNVAVALRVAAAGASESALQAVLSDPGEELNIGASVSWQGAPVPDVWRRPFSIGSCSLAEPDEDLAQLAA